VRDAGDGVLVLDPSDGPVRLRLVEGALVLAGAAEKAGALPAAGDTVRVFYLTNEDGPPTVLAVEILGSSQARSLREWERTSGEGPAPAPRVGPDATPDAR